MLALQRYCRQGVTLAPAPTLDCREFDQLQEGFQPERPGSDRIFVKMRLEKPLVRIDLLCPLQITEPCRSSVCHKKLDLIDHPELLLGEGAGLGVRELDAAPELFGARDVRGCIADADLVRQRLLGEEAEHGLALVQHAVTVRYREVELLDDHATAGGRLGQGGAGGQGAAFRRHGPMLHGVSSQISEGDVGRAGERGADVGGEPATGLQCCFEQDREGHARLPVGGEIPLVNRNVVLGLGHGARDHLPRLPAQGGDTIHELERRPGQTGDLAAGIEDPVLVAKPVGRVAVTVGQDLFLGIDSRLLVV